MTGCGGTESSEARAPVEPEEGIISEYGYTVYKTQFSPENMPDQVSITYKFSKPVEYRDSMIYPLEGNTEVRISSDVRDTELAKINVNLYPVEGQGNVYANVSYLPEDFPSNLTKEPNFYQEREVNLVQFTSALTLQLSGFLIVDPGPFDPGPINIAFGPNDGFPIIDPTTRPIGQ